MVATLGELRTLSVVYEQPIDNMNMPSLVLVDGQYSAQRGVAVGQLVEACNVAPADIFEKYPKKRTWTVEEVEQCIDRCVRVPEVHNVIVLHVAETITSAALQRVLKSTEEPPTPTMFVLAGANLKEILPATILGRAGKIITTGPIRPHTAAAFTKDRDSAVLRRLLEKDLFDLAVLYSDASDKTLDALATVLAVARTPSPAVATIAAVTKALDIATSDESLEFAAAVQDTVTAVVMLFREQLTAELHSSEYPTPDRHRVHVARAEALDRVSSGLAKNIPIKQLLTEISVAAVLPTAERRSA